MGLEGYDNSGTIFLKLKHGHICQESKSEIDGWKRVETEYEGKTYTKYIKPYRAVSGYVNKVEFYDREHNGRKFRGWTVTIDADGTRCSLDIPFDSNANSRFMNLAENIDWTKPVRFSAWKDQKKDSLAFNVQQDGVSVPQKYTRENPANRPEPVQRASGKWDYGAQEDFLVQRMTDYVIPAVEAAQVNAALRNEPADEIGGQEQGLEDHHAGPPSSPTSSRKESILINLQKSITEYATENQVSKTAAVEEWFGTKNWSEVTVMEEGVLKAVEDKLTELLCPF